MNQIITIFICKIPSLSALIPLVLSFSEGYANTHKYMLRLHNLEYPLKIQPYKAGQAGILYVNISSKEEKDEVLEELKFSAQGIFTDSENTKTSQKDHSAESHTNSANNGPAHPQKEKNNQTNNPAQTENTAHANKARSNQKNEKTTDQTKNVENALPAPPSIAEPKENPSNDDVSVHQEIQEYSAGPSRVKKEMLEKKLNSMIRQNPKNETAHWKLFELYHHYMEWSQDTEFYQENQAFQTLKLLQDMYKTFGENQKIMKYLCQYFVINHLYVESKTYCQKAKKLLPDDTDLHLYADYFNESIDSSSQTSPLSKSQRLLHLLKTKNPSEKLYTIIGKMFADKKKDKLSMKYFQKAVKLNDSYIPGLLGLSETLLRLGQYQSALKYYVLACQKHPYKSRTPFQKAKAYLNRNSLFKTAGEYQNQINICINSIKTSH